MPNTNWMYFPKSNEPGDFIRKVVNVFQSREEQLTKEAENLSSNQVLAILRPGLEALGFDAEAGKKVEQKIKVPVLFGRNGIPEKSFEADAWHRQQKMVLEVEAGRGYLNNQFLKDLFQACMMHDIDTCCIAVRNQYLQSRDFEQVLNFFETLYSSGRLRLPLVGVLILGYGRQNP